MSQVSDPSLGVVVSGPPSERTWRHEVTLRHRVGQVSLDVQFTLKQPWTVLFAPSGAGKTTVLRLIAGLDRPAFGYVAIRLTSPETEFVLTDTDKEVFVPPHKRAVQLVSQRPYLFPHKTVRANVTFRMLLGGRNREEWQSGQDEVEEILRMWRISEIQHKMPHQLSGGERQRVALARCIGAGAGRLLMLDEPFTGLDSALRDDLIAELKHWQAKRGGPILHVTHDIGEVFATGAEVMRMEGGRIVAMGPPNEVLAEEKERLLGILGSGRE